MAAPAGVRAEPLADTWREVPVDRQGEGARAQTLVLGLGNPLLTDDGVGVRVAAEVRRALPPGAPVAVREVSIGGLALMEAMLGYQRVILVDALQSGEDPPGTVRRLTLAELEALCPTQHSTCVHDTSLPTALEVARRMGLSLPREVVIYTVEAENVVDFGDRPTPAVARAIAPLARTILAELGL